MAKTIHINGRLDLEIKSQAEASFEKFGTGISEAVNFFHQSIMYGGISFELRIPNCETIEAMEDAINCRNLRGSYRIAKRTHGDAKQLMLNTHYERT